MAEAATQNSKPGKKISSAYIYFFGAFGGLLFGYDIGVMTGALPFLKESWHLTQADSIAWITSILMFGAIFGGLVAGKVSDKLGRKNAILGAAVIFVGGALLSAFTPNLMLSWMLISRFILGVAVGAASALVPPYVSEMAPAEKRGRLSSLNQLMIVSGMLISYIVDFLLRGFPSAYAWRLMVGAAAIPAIVLFFGALRLPESPRFLVRSGKASEARTVLSFLRPANLIDNELQDIEQTVAEENKAQQNVSFKTLFSNKYIYLVLAGVGVAAFQQFMGANAIFYYIPLIVEEVSGTAATDALQWPIVNGVILVAGALVYMAIADKFKRRTLLTVGGSVMAFAFLMPTILTLTLGPNGFPPMTIVGFLCLFNAFYSFTWAPLTWVLVGEVFPLAVRGQASGLASSMNWLGSFAVGLFFPILAAMYASSTVFFIFGIICILAVLYVRFRVPETKGKTLEEIEMQAGK